MKAYSSLVARPAHDVNRLPWCKVGTVGSLAVTSGRNLENAVDQNANTVLLDNLEVDGAMFLWTEIGRAHV